MTIAAGSDLDQRRVRPLISEADIRQSVEQLGRRISADYDGRPLLLVGVLTGSIVFVADLMRRITVPHRLGLLQASSYRGDATSPGELIVNLDAIPEVRGADVLLVDDILDTGRTLSRLIGALQERGAASVRCAVLLWKKSRTEAPPVPDYCGFEIPDEFVVGYGLDFNGEHRHLPFIGVITQEPEASAPGAIHTPSNQCRE